MKIWYEVPRPAAGQEAFYAKLKANWKKVGKSDSELIIKAPSKGASDFDFNIVGHMYADMLRTVEIVEGIMQAEKEGYDAAVNGCFGDPGLDAMEALVDIPVIGPAKASMIMAQTVGSKMAFVTLPRWEDKVEKFIRIYGIENMVISKRPCRAFNIQLEQFKNEDQVIDNFFTIAKGAIEDGADVIILACANCSTQVTYKGISEINGIPIIDGAIAALKLVEIMADLKKAGLWRSKKNIGKDVMEGLRKEYYHGLASV